MKWLSLIALTALVGCVERPQVLDDGYQVGDITRAAIELQDSYCRDGDIATQALLFVILDEFKPMTGDENLCEIDIPALIMGR